MDPISRTEAAVPDPARTVREFVLAERRRALAPPGTRLLAVTTAAEAAAAPEGDAAFDAAWVAPDCVEEIDLPALGLRVTRALRPGAPIVCVIPGAWPLRTVLDRALRGLGTWSGRPRARVEGRSPARTAAREWRRAFGDGFAWRPARAMGVLLPAPSGWAQRRPLVFGLLAAADHVVGAWPVLRALGDLIVLEGVRR
jgi:hypothetical protein